MRTLAIDIETYSSAEPKKCGVYKYVESPDFEILLFAYSIDGGAVAVVDFNEIGSARPCVDDKYHLHVLRRWLTDPAILKTAFNASFERACISKAFNINLPPEQWECTMVKSAMLGLPLSLDMVGKVLNLEQQKGAEGKALINYFSKPCKPTKANGGRTRNLPEHDPEEWARFVEYCRQDVVTEQAVRKAIEFFTVPPAEAKLWQLDQRINDAGILLDPVLVEQAISLDADYKGRLTTEAVALTGLSNPNSAAQLKSWLSAETLRPVDTLRKADVSAMLLDAEDDMLSDASEGAVRMLQIRQELAKTSVKKYAAMAAFCCADDRVRGLFQFYGANRTGRWAGRGIQMQNLPRNELRDLDLARRLVRGGEGDLVEMLYGNVPDTLSQLIRTAFVAPPGCRLLVADFSAIEARVIAWLAGERWRLDVFNTHGKIYEASAAQMFKVPIEAVTKGSDMRQKGKVAELALGYQGGPGALVAMGALKMGLLEEELPALVRIWRNANKKIERLWYDVERAALETVESGQRTTLRYGIAFQVEHGVLFITLPSGRRLAYYKPTLGVNKFDKLAIRYEGVNDKNQWGVLDTYGGKLVENIVQAIARDCLAVAMLRLDAAGYRIACHVHDEVVLEVPDYEGSTEDVNAIMGKPIAWAPGLPLGADSYETLYYKKD